MLFRLIVQPNELPPMNSARKTELYCKPILEVLRDNSKCLETFRKASDILEKAEMDIQSRDHLKQARITEALIKEFEKEYQ